MFGSLFVRDAAMMVVIFGVAGFVWFGWGQEDPPRRWRAPLGVGAGVGVLVAAAGGVLAWRHWGPDSVFAAQDTRRAFGIVTGIEFGAATLGAVILVLRKKARWISTWICLVVGVHFYPLARILHDPGLLVLATVMTLVAVFSATLSRRFDLHPSTLVGAAAGTALLLYAVRCAIVVLV